MTRLASLLLCGCARARRARLGSSLCTASPARLEPLRASTRSRPCKRACWPAASISMWSPRAHPRRPMPRAALPSSRAIKRPRAVWSALGWGWAGLVDESQLAPEDLEPFTYRSLPLVGPGDEVWHGAATRHRSRCSRRCGRRRRARRAVRCHPRLQPGSTHRRHLCCPPAGQRAAATRRDTCGGFRIPFPIEAAPFWPPSRAPLRVPSLHVIGVRDMVVAPCRSEALVRDFADAETHTHELIGRPRAYAGHVLVGGMAPFTIGWRRCCIGSARERKARLGLPKPGR